VEHTVRQAARRDPIVRALDQIPGIAEVLGLMIRAEIGAIGRFAHPAQRQLCRAGAARDPEWGQMRARADHP
jgi:transposase